MSGDLHADIIDMALRRIGVNPKRGRGKSKKSLALIEASRLILEEIQPATVRAVCYRLFVAGQIDSMSKANTNAVGTQLVYAREQGLIPWSHIVDETREAERIASWDHPDQLLDCAVNQYRRNHWQDQPERVEVWSEKGTVRGTLAPVLNEFGVTFRVMHGYGSATSLYQIAQETQINDKPLTVFYVGDWDPSGLNMSEVDIPRRMDRYEGDADIERVALIAGELAELPHFDVETKSKDPRYKWFREHYGKKCWELDAMSPVDLRERVRAKIIGHLDVDAWNHAVHVEQAEIKSMEGFLKDWQSKSRPARKYSGRGA